MSSNSLIPYSFTPGAKAKAQEVNANFIALAEKIEENKEYTTTQIAETVEQIEEAAAESETKKADKNLGNTNLITNCILECPNGVVTVSENVITVKAGLKLLIPDGFNEDGTVKNITYEVEEDTAVTTVSNSEINCIYVTPNGCYYATAYYTCECEPRTKQGLWYKLSENKTYLYKSDTQTWDVIQAVVVATYENTSDTVSFVAVAKPVRLLTSSDRMSIVNFRAPDYSSVVSQSYSGTYTAKQAGYLYISSIAQPNQQQNVIINNHTFSLSWANSNVTVRQATVFPLKRGDVYWCSGTYHANSNVEFIPMEGDM